MGNLGLLYYNQGKYQEAIDLLKKALDVYINLFGNLNEHVAENLFILGTIYYSINKYNYSLEYFEEALKIYIKLNEKTHSYEEEINNIQNYIDKAREKVMSPAIDNYDKRYANSLISFIPCMRICSA